jgi:hypothetical protein
MPSSLFRDSLYLKLSVQPCRALCYFAQLSLWLYLKNRDTSLLVLIVLTVLKGGHHPSRAAPGHPIGPLLFQDRLPISLFLVADFSLTAIALSRMENTTRKRTRKAGAPEVVALKKSVSAALKAAWHVEQLRARIEKPKRERNTLAKKVELQRAALEEVKATVESLLEGLKPAGKPLVETLNTSLVLEPSAAA